MGNYLNPVIFKNGIEFFNDYYLGWVLTGGFIDADHHIRPSTEDNNYLLGNDICIGGFSVPVKASSVMRYLSDDTNMGSDSNSYSVPKTDDDGNIVYEKDSEGNYILDEDGNKIMVTTTVTASGTTLNFDKETSTISSIFPISSDDSMYIDLSNYTLKEKDYEGEQDSYIYDGGILLVAYKYDFVKDLIVDDKISKENWNSFVETNWLNKKYNYNEGKYSYNGNTESVFLNSDNCVPFFYNSVTNSTKINTGNVNGFRVGNISIKLSGIENN